MVVYGCLTRLNYFVKSSIKHAYDGKWTENTRLSTCDPHARKTVTNSETPQEVEDKKEIIFTYDVDFVVSNYAIKRLLISFLLFLEEEIIIYRGDKVPQFYEVV